MATVAGIKRSQAIHPDSPAVRARIQRGPDRRWQFVEEARQHSHSQYAGALPILDFLKNQVGLEKRFRDRITLKKGRNSVDRVPERLMGMVALYITDKKLCKRHPEGLVLYRHDAGEQGDAWGFKRLSRGSRHARKPGWR